MIGAQFFPKILRKDSRLRSLGSQAGGSLIDPLAVCTAGRFSGLNRDGYCSP